ncbi:unnamed protein product [Arctia plantaginis]|uniref:Cytochrome P450 302a1, mitochondrial n=1 Tax=Arctia plantaginis TaxID=874455 RepID=A0A8S1AGI6_ARCPL|nr:unnamed protein product [Arctia plantaginis]
MLQCYLSKKVTQPLKSISLVSKLATSCNENIREENKHVMQDSVMNFDEIPGPKTYPIIGTLYKYLPYIGEYNVEALDKNSWLNYKRYGTLVREAPGVRMLHVFDPEDIEVVFRQEYQYPARRSHLAVLHYRTRKPNVYNTGGLLCTNGPEWWRLRSKFQKKFTSPQSVKSFVTSTDGIVTEFIKWIEAKKVSHSEDFLPYLNKLNLEVIGMVAFNERFRSFSPEEQESGSRSNKLIEAAFGSNAGIMKLDQGFLWKYVKTPLYKKLYDSQEYLEKESSKIFLNKANFFEKESCSENSLLTSFLQQPDLDMKDIVGMMVDILMAAIDTTAYSTSFALYHISRNQQIQEILYSEVAALLPTKDCRITSEILSKAVYLKSCLKETLRLNPVSIGVGRQAQKDFVLRGYLIPKGTVIVTQNMIASRLPQYVRDPLHFKPERWLRGSEMHENIHPFLSLPFGFGTRSCIARRLAEQNMCVILMRLIRNYEIKWMGGELGIRTFLINKPDSPISLSFVPRISALPTPDKLHTNLQEPLFPPEDLPPLAVYFLRKQPYLETHNIKIKCSKNELGRSLPEICSDLLRNDFEDSNVIKKIDEEKLKEFKKDLEEFKAEEVEDPEKTTDSSPSGEKEEEKNSKEIEDPEKITDSSPSGEKEEEKNSKEIGDPEKTTDASPSGEKEEEKHSKEIEDSLTDKKETTTKKLDIGEKESGENFTETQDSEDKEPFEPEVIPPEENKKPSILSIFSPILHFFDNIISYWKPKSKFDTQRSFYIIEIESDYAV